MSGLFGMFEQRAGSLESPAVPLTAENIGALLGAQGANDAGVPVTEQTALKLSTVYRCTALISSVAAALPLPVYEGYDRTRRQVDSQIIQEPHPDLTAYDLDKIGYAHRCLWGNMYQQKVRNRAGEIVERWPIHPGRVRPYRGRPSAANPSGKLFDVTDEWGTVWRALTSRDILHVPGLGYDGIAGVSPVRLAAQAIGLALAAEKYAAKLFGSGNLQSGYLTTDEDLEEDDAIRLQGRWKQRSAGLDRAHEVPVLDHAAKFVSMTMPNDDAQFLESRSFEVTDVSRFFGVPQFLLSETEKSTSWGCVPGDTLVFTTEGPRPIEDVSPGDEVWSFTGTGMEPAKVTAWHRTGHKPLLTLRTTARELRVTANHRVPVRRYFGIASGRSPWACGWETIEVSAGEIRVGDYLLVPHGLRDGDRRTAPNGRDLTVPVMEFCGLYTGDGSSDKNRVEIAHGNGDPHVGYYSDVVRSEFSVDPYTDPNRGTRTRFSSATARDLLECGFTGRAHSKRVPPWVFRLAPDLQLAFLRGYLDADGCVIRGVISFASANRALLEDVRHLCIGLGIPVGRVRLGRRAGVGEIRGQRYVSRDKWVLNLSSTPFNVRIGSNHPEKAARLTDRPTTRRLRYDDGWEGGLGVTAKRKPSSQTPGGAWNVDDVRLQRVVSIDQGQVQVPVFDITVADHAHYVADGVVVHNTGLEQQAQGWVTFDLHPQWLAPHESRITRELLPAGQRAKYKLQGLLRGDSTARAEFYRAMRELGGLSADDMRELEDMPPVEGPGGDEYYRPANLVPLGTPAEQPPAPPEPDPEGDPDAQE